MKLYSTKVVARHLDLTERRVRQLRDEGVLPDVRPGLFDLELTNHRYIAYLRDRRPEGAAVDYQAEKALLAKAKRESEEYELALKRKELHKSEDIRLIMGAMLANFRSRLMAIPAKESPVLAKESDPLNVSTVLKKSIDEALEELSNFDCAFLMEESPDEPEDG